MKKIFSAIIISYFLLIISLQPILAATDSADISDQKIKESISDRLKKVAGTQDESTQQIKQGWAGTIEDITQNNSLAIKINGQTQMVQVNTQAKIVNEDKYAIKFENLEIGQYILAMGYLQSNQVLDAKRLVILPQPKPLKYQSYFATIKQIGKKSITVEIENSNFTLEYDDDTKFTQAVDNSQAEIELKDLKAEDLVIFIATPDPKDDSTLLITNLHLINSRIILADPDTATPSAETE